MTGGASGLGEATVRRLVRGGAKAVIVDLNEEKGAALSAELGDAALFVKTDVCLVQGRRGGHDPAGGA